MTINRNLSILAGGVSSTGVLGVPNGGSGATTLTGYLIGNGTSAFTASTTIPTSALSGTVSLTTQISGILPIANGGTAKASFTANQIHYGSFSTSAGLTFDGTNFATTGYASATSFRPTASTIPTNGLFLPTTNTLGFATNSAEIMRLFSSGGISIGNTTDPGAKNLSVTGKVTAPNLQGPAFSATAASFSLSNVTYTKIAFNTESFDTNSNYDATTNYRFTPTVAGYYQINITCAYGPAATGGTNTAIYFNGTLFTASSGILSAAFFPYSTVTALMYFNGSTDYVEAYAYQASGSAITAYPSLFSGSMIRSA